MISSLMIVYGVHEISKCEICDVQPNSHIYNIYIYIDIDVTPFCHSPRLLRDRSLPNSSTAWIDDALRQGAKKGRWPTAVPDMLGEPWVLSGIGEDGVEKDA